MKKLPAQPIQGLVDGLSVLQELAASSRPISCLELSDILGLEKTKVNRILKTLDYLGFTEKTTDRKYYSGPGMHVLAAQSLFASGLLQRALPYLRTFEKYNGVVALGVLWRNQVSYLYHWNPQKEFTSSLAGGSLYPVQQSSIGMALLAEKTDEEIKDIIKDEEIHDYYHNSFSTFMNVICEIRKKGFSCLGMRETRIGMTIGAPAYAAIGINGNFSEVQQKQIIDDLTYATQQIAIK